MNKPYGLIEEIINSVTHGVGAMLSSAALALMIITAVNNESGVQLASAIIFGCSLIMLFLASTLYHSFSNPLLKSVFKIIDHCAIYLLIAGTYTPFLLVSLNNTVGYITMAVIWSLALLGIVFKIFYRLTFPKLSLITYLAMGWLVVAIMPQMIDSVPTGGLVLLSVGGALYSLGAIFYAIKKIPYNHAIWHCFVLAASICHFLAVYLYVME